MAEETFEGGEVGIDANDFVTITAIPVMRQFAEYMNRVYSDSIFTIDDWWDQWESWRQLQTD